MIGYNLFMRILGIDPGIGRLGWAIIDHDKGKQYPVAYDCLETEKNALPEKRLEQIYDQLQSICKEYKPDALAIEDLFFNKNVTTAFSVGQARGVVLLVASQHNLPVTIYTPSQIKIAVTGYGKAEKQQVGHMIKLIFKLDKLPKLDDTVDALAIALTHAFSVKSLQYKKHSV